MNLIIIFNKKKYLQNLNPKSYLKIQMSIYPKPTHVGNKVINIRIEVKC